MSKGIKANYIPYYQRGMRANYIPVYPGDIIEVFFDFHAAEKKGPFMIKVRSVERRYGRINDGTTYRSPVVTGTDCYSDEERNFSAIFITKVFRRTSSRVIAPATNIFREAICLLRPEFKGSLWKGSLTTLAIHALARLPHVLDRSLHEERLRDLYERTPLGCKKTEWDGRYYTVNKHLFMKWVQQNWSRILMTSEEMHAAETAFQMKMEDQHWESVEFQMDKELNEEWGWEKEDALLD